MKKISKLLLILVLLFSCDIVKADNNYNYKYIICQYSYQVQTKYKKPFDSTEYTATSQPYYVTIKYNQHGEGYYYDAPTGCKDVDFQCESLKAHNIGLRKDLLDSTYVFGEDTKVFAEGKCPAEVYVDLEGMANNAGTSQVEICMGSKDNCKKATTIGHCFGDCWGIQGGKTIESANIINIKKVYDIGERKDEIQDVVESSMSPNYEIDTTKKLGEGTTCDKLYYDDSNNILETGQEEMIEKLKINAENSYDAQKKAAIAANVNTHIDLISWFDIPVNKKQDYIEGLIRNVTNSCRIVANNSREDLTEQEQIKLDDAQTAVDDAVDLVIQKYFDATVNIGSLGGDESCTGFLGNPENKSTPAYYLTFTLNLIKYAGIAATFIFSIIDFLKAITSQDKDLLQKAIKSSSQRLVLAIVIFFLPIIIDYVLELFGAYGTCIK